MAERDRIPLPARTEDLTGRVFGTRTVVEYAGSRRGISHWLCKCECGRVNRLTKFILVSGGRCRCVHDNMKRKHGLCRSTEYHIWQGMKARCNNVKCRQYQRYGARGIQVCQRWLDDFANFIADMGRRPGLGYSVDRIDNDGDYEPSNCRWATDSEQNRNKKNTPFLSIGGRNAPLVEWAEHFGVDLRTVYGRMSRGWSMVDAVSIPAAKKTVTFRGSERSIASVAREFGISRTMLNSRLLKGWPIEKAVSVPPDKGGSGRTLLERVS